MPWPVQPDCQPSRTSWSWLATGMAALDVDVSSGPKMKLACTWVTHLCTSAAAVAGSDASFSCTSVTLWPSTPPALLTLASQAGAQRPSSTRGRVYGPDRPSLAHMVSGDPDEFRPPPPELPPPATPTTRTALAAA